MSTLFLFNYKLNFFLVGGWARSSQAYKKIVLDIFPDIPILKLERIFMDTKQLKRIADAIEEILRLVKEDMKPKK